MPERLFVYGSLGPGGPNHGLLEHLGGEWMPASVRGHLIDAGWGAEMGYPGIVLDDDGEPVAGYVFACEDLVDHWDELDAFEGRQYRRVATVARLADDTTVEAFVYVLRD